VSGLTTEMEHLLELIRQLAAVAPTLQALQKGIVAAIAEVLPYCNWSGFYMLDPAGDPETLVLGPFVGEPTPHVRIPIGRGICGAAVSSGRTIVVANVNEDARYLSCSIKTKSEIVVPIFAHATCVGEIDIDSHNLAAFTEADRAFLEEVARIVGTYIDGLRS
jgi:L-methionine (R)-S-oxide reductase